MGNEEKDIADLKARMAHVEKEIESIQEEQSQWRDDYTEDSKKAAIEGEKMAGELRAIKKMLKDLLDKKVRLVDVVIALGMLLTGAMSAYAAIQNNHLTQIMVELTKQVTK